MESSTSLNAFTKALIKDLRELRAGKITLADARVRTQLAREILRSIHLQIQGAKLLSARAKQIPAEKKDGQA